LDCWDGAIFLIERWTIYHPLSGRIFHSFVHFALAYGPDSDVSSFEGLTMVLLSRVSVLLFWGGVATIMAGCSDLREKPSPPTKEREAYYNLKLQEYAAVLQVGMTRRQVEDFFRSKGIRFRQMCCIDEKNAFADLVAIGKEKPPWYCGHYNVYIAFQFAATEPRPQRQFVLATESDLLARITVYYWLENCM
jgi:hypothetical protein